MQKGNVGNICTPLLTQVKHRYCAADCGMTYVMRLQDGRFVVIDGGYDEAGEAQHLFQLLTEQNVLDGKPHIAAWFITHPHDDHFGGLVGLCREFADRFQLDALVYNFPPKHVSNGFSDLVPFEMAVQSLKNTKIITVQTGERFVFGDTTFDILFTWEDLGPIEGLVNLNDCSLVIRMTVGDRRVMFLGDAMPVASAVLCERYTDEELRAEFLQVGHHGYGGGSDELYRRIDPETLLWPCPDFWFHAVRLWPCNEFLITAPSIKHTIVSGQAEVTLDMTRPVSAFKPYPPCGGIVYEEYFAHTDPYRLGWSAVTGGATGNASPLLDVFKGGCTLTAGDARTVTEWVQPGRMDGIENFTLRFSGEVDETPETVGIIFNSATPTVWDDTAFLPLPLPAGDFTVTLTADAEEGCVTFTVNEEDTAYTLPYAPAVRRGIYFVLKNGKVTLREVNVIK